MKNELDQTLGESVSHWTGAKMPMKIAMVGQYCRLEPLNIVVHAEALFDAFSQDTENRNWTYLPYGPFECFDDFKQWLKGVSSGSTPMFYAIVDQQSNEAIGIASYLRIKPEHGVIEVGHVHFSPALQKTQIATEAMFLMMKNTFDELGYRRYEWKCNALNESSRNAALRLGFSFEGVFRQALVIKGRNRDTAWYSMLDSEWPQVKQAFKQWLRPENFDAEGRQKSRLKTCSQ